VVWPVLARRVAAGMASCGSSWFGFTRLGGLRQACLVRVWNVRLGAARQAWSFPVFLGMSEHGLVSLGKARQARYHLDW
jgi:hypothetical protein